MGILFQGKDDFKPTVTTEEYDLIYINLVDEYAKEQERLKKKQESEAEAARIEAELLESLSSGDGGLDEDAYALIQEQLAE